MKTKKGQTFNCELCGAEFYRKLSYIARGHQIRFCSHACYMQAVECKLVDRSGPRPHRKTGEMLACGVCEKQYYRKGSEIRNGVNKTCSIECRNVWLSGERNFFHGQFQNLPPRPPAWTAKQRKEWLDAACVRCGSTDKLELDHITPRGTHTRENTQTLCRGCNQRKCWNEDRFHYRQIPQGGLSC